MEHKHLVWLDCDPGTDDAAALLLIHAAPELELVGISTVSGNVRPEHTFRNALRLNRLLGSAYPVYAGADRPWILPPEYGVRFHGPEGLGNTNLPLPERWEKPALPGWEALYQAALAHGGAMELIATGPLTNVATALTLHPDLTRLLRRVVLMGGSATVGNKTPAAEFNIWADPHAAKAVFEAGFDLTMCGLDVTNRAYLTRQELDSLGALGTPAARFLHQALQTPLQASGGELVRLHDPTAVLYAARPALFSGQRAGVRVETRGSITRGKTVTDLWSDKKFPEQNAYVVLGVDRPRFVETVMELIGSLG